MPIPRLWHVQRIPRARSICSAPSTSCRKISTGARRRSKRPWPGPMSLSLKSPTDEKAQAEIRRLVGEMGMLPPGQSLRASLEPSARADFDAAIAQAHLPPDVVDHERPWLVSLQLLVAEGEAKQYSADAGRGSRRHGDRRQNAQANAFLRDDRAAIPPSGRKRQRSSAQGIPIRPQGLSEGRRRSGAHGCGLEQGPGRQACRADEFRTGRPARCEEGIADRPQPALGPADRDHAAGKARLLHHRRRGASGRPGRRPRTAARWRVIKVEGP